MEFLHPDLPNCLFAGFFCVSCNLRFFGGIFFRGSTLHSSPPPVPVHLMPSKGRGPPVAAARHCGEVREAAGGGGAPPDEAAARGAGAGDERHALRQQAAAGRVPAKGRPLGWACNFHVHFRVLAAESVGAPKPSFDIAGT